MPPSPHGPGLQDTATREAWRLTHRMSSWPRTVGTGVWALWEGGSKNAKGCQGMQTRPGVQSGSPPSCSLPSLSSSPSGSPLLPFRERQAFWAGLMLTELSAFLNACLGGTEKHPRPLSYFVAFYFPASISPSSMSLLKMMGWEGAALLDGWCQILGKK